MLYKSLPFLLLIVFISTTNAQDREDRPVNIVLFIADDLGINDTGPYGNPVVKTPNLDEFAKRSLLFTNAFATSPTCAPSRSSMFTGLMPFRNGAHSNHSGVTSGTKSLVHYLEPLGYRLALGGKLHIGPAEVFPFEKIANTNIREPGTEGKPGLHYDLNMDPIHAWLARQQKEKPFMLVVADHSPHVVWPYDAQYDPEEVDIPSKHIDTWETRKSRARYYTDITKMDENFGKLLRSLDQLNLSDNTMVIFVSDQGPQWPFAKWTLYDEGVQVPMLVHWKGKVEPGGKSDAMVSLVDLLPSFVELAGGKAPEDIDGKSFLPVLTGDADTHRKKVFATHTGDGEMNCSPSRMLRTKRYKYLLNLAPGTKYTTHMDRVKREGVNEYWESWRDKSFSAEHAAAVLWRYHNHPPEELYDLREDSQEIRNLAADPNYAGELNDLRKEMASWRKQQKDFESGPEELPKKKKIKGKPVAPYVF